MHLLLMNPKDTMADIPCRRTDPDRPVNASLRLCKLEDSACQIGAAFLQMVLHNVVPVTIFSSFKYEGWHIPYQTRHVRTIRLCTNTIDSIVPGMSHQMRSNVFVSTGY